MYADQGLEPKTILTDLQEQELKLINTKISLQQRPN